MKKVGRGCRRIGGGNPEVTHMISQSVLTFRKYHDESGTRINLNMNIPLVKLLDLFSFLFRSYHFNCFAHMSEKNLKVIFGQKLAWLLDLKTNPSRVKIIHQE